MIIALFGVTCVGKTTIGRILGEELGYDFYDLDEETKLFFNDTITNIQDSCFNQHAYDGKLIEVLKTILRKCSRDSIIAVSPIYYTAKYRCPFQEHNVFSIELRDLPENIARRVIYTDDDDNLIENQKIDYEHEVRETKRSISYYKKAHEKIKNKYFIDGKTAQEAAMEIVEMINSDSLVPQL